MEKYVSPEMNIVEFDSEDVITTSVVLPEQIIDES